MRWLAVALLVVTAACGGNDRIDSIDDVREGLEDDDAFVGGEEAGRSFARIADALLELGRECVDEDGDEDPRCERLLAAAAFAQVFAPDALSCTEPGIFEAREGLREYLDGGDEVPQVPACA